jgi:hypothetical protein
MKNNNYGKFLIWICCIAAFGGVLFAQKDTPFVPDSPPKPPLTAEELEIRRQAMQAFSDRTRGLSDQERVDVQPFVIGYDLPDFAKRGDKLWECRMLNREFGWGLTGLLWLNPGTHQVVLLAIRPGPETGPQSRPALPKTAKSDDGGSHAQ